MWARNTFGAHKGSEEAAANDASKPENAQQDRTQQDQGPTRRKTMEPARSGAKTLLHRIHRSWGQAEWK